MPPASVDNLIRGCEGLSLSVSLERSQFSLDDLIGKFGPGSSLKSFQGGFLLATLLYRMKVTVSAFEKAMLSAWATIWGVTMIVLEDNLFLFHFEHRIDLNKVLREGSWRFNQFLLVMKEVAGRSPLNREILSSIQFWVQIYRIPVLQQSEFVDRPVRGLLGPIIVVDFGAGRNRFPFLRVCVDVDVQGHLPKGPVMALALTTPLSATALLQQVSPVRPSVSLGPTISAGSSIFHDGDHPSSDSSIRVSHSKNGPSLVFSSGATIPPKVAGKTKVKKHRRATTSGTSLGPPVMHKPPTPSVPSLPHLTFSPPPLQQTPPPKMSFPTSNTSRRISLLLLHPNHRANPIRLQWKPPQRPSPLPSLIISTPRPNPPP